MGSRLLWIIVIIVIVAAGAWYFITKDTATTPISTTTTNNSGGSNNLTPPPSTQTGSQTGGTDVGMEDGTGGTGTPAPNTQGYDALMTWTDNGFNPTTLTIKKGETVRFLNQGTGSFWPASDVHPTHRTYPQKSPSDCLGSSFDACKGLSAGAFFDFTFTSAGSWGCHNHLRASHRCTIVVE
jgi:plastocyanin